MTLKLNVLSAMIFEQSLNHQFIYRTIDYTSTLTTIPQETNVNKNKCVLKLFYNKLYGMMYEVYRCMNPSNDTKHI